MQIEFERERKPNSTNPHLEGLRNGMNQFIGGLIGRNREASPVVDLYPSSFVRLQALEDYPGVVTFPATTKKNTTDTIVAFSGRVYLEKLSYLKDAAVLFLQRNTLWSLDFCRQLMDKGMGVDELTWGRELNEETIAEVMRTKEREVPSVFLFRGEGVPEGHYLGISVQRKLFINTDLAGEVPVMEHVLRVFEPDYRGKGRGRLTVSLGLLAHKGAQFYLHKTGNPIAAHTNQLSDYLEQVSAHPWGARTISDPLMQEVRKETERYIMLPGRTMLPNGVIKGDYPERSRSFDVKDLRGGALDTYGVMTDPKQLDMRIDGENEDGKGYDSVVPLYRVR